MTTLLALDCGTQSVRALLFDGAGTLLARSQVKFDPPYRSPQPGWAEQAPEYYWDCLAEACRQLWARGADRRAIAGVALTAQRGTVVCLDAEGEPLRPAITWLDQREATRLAPMALHWEALLRLGGAADIVRHFRRQAECNWIAQFEPEIWQRTRRYLLLSGYLNFRLCGEFHDSVAGQVGYLPFDFKRHDWCRDGDWKWQAMTIRREQLAQLRPPGALLGSITAQASAETGIPLGLPLVATGADKACEVLGSGSLEPDVAALSFGTSATINTTQPRYVEVTRLLPPYPAAVPGAYLTEVQVLRGFWMVNWFKEEFGHLEQEMARTQGKAAETLFDELLRQTPPGAMGLMLQPYWSPGIRKPGREAKGALIGFGDVHGRAHFYRVIIEGLAYALRQGCENIERRTRRRVTRLRVSGGGSQSDEVMQIAANVFGLPAERPHTYETSGLGAAMNIAVGVGLHADYAGAVRAMCHVGRVFEPEPVHQALYDRLYRRVWRRLYRRLRPLYAEIRTLTGYPD